MLDVRQLRVLREVSRRGNFSRAAEALSVSPSAISQQVAALERQVGARLFERGRDGVQVTDAGRMLLSHAERILAELEDARERLRDLREEEGAELRLGSFPGATTALLPGALVLLRARAPGVRLLVIDGAPEESEQRLRHRELDLALVFDLGAWPSGARPPLDPPGLEREALFEDEYLLVVGDDHPLAGRGSARLEDLAGAHIMCPPPLCDPWSEGLSGLLREAGIAAQFDASYQTTDYLGLQGMVAATGAVALIPRLALATLRPDLATLSLAGGPNRRVRMATRAGGYRSRGVRVMAQVLVELAAALRPAGDDR